MGRAGLVRPGCPPGRSATLLRAIFRPRALALRQMFDNGGGRITSHRGSSLRFAAAAIAFGF